MRKTYFDVSTSKCCYGFNFRTQLETLQTKLAISFRDFISSSLINLFSNLQPTSQSNLIKALLFLLVIGSNKSSSLDKDGGRSGYSEFTHGLPRGRSSPLSFIDNRHDSIISPINHHGTE